MKKIYELTHDNTHIRYDTAEARDKDSIPEVLKHMFPQYDASEIKKRDIAEVTYYGNGNNYTLESETGETLIELIENNFKSIIDNANACGASGYTLKSVSLEYKGEDKAILNIIYWPFSSALVGYKKEMLNTDKLYEKHIEFKGVDVSDFADGNIYNFEIKKN